MSLLSSKKNKCLATGAGRGNFKRLNKDFRVLFTSSQVYNENKKSAKKSKSKSDKHYVVYDVIQNVSDTVKEFMIVINGPPGTSYEGGYYVFNVNVVTKKNTSYPFCAPKVTCLTKIYHPNVDPSGNICLDILAGNWSAAQSFMTVATSLSSFLVDPNPDDPLYGSAAHLYNSNRKKYDATVEDYKKKYATIEKYNKLKNGEKPEKVNDYLDPDLVNNDDDFSDNEDDFSDGEFD